MKKNLSLNEQADQSSFIGYISESLYNCQLFNWWAQDENYQLFTHRIYASKVSFPLNFYVPYKMRSSIIQKLQFNDYTPDNAEMVYEKADEIYKSLSIKLGDKNFFFGDSPTTLDAVAYGFLISQSAASLPQANLRNHILNYHNLVDYCNRITTLFFGSEVKANLVYVPHLKTSKKKPTKSPERIKNEKFDQFIFIGGLAILIYFAYSWNFSQVNETQNHQNSSED